MKATIMIGILGLVLAGLLFGGCASDSSGAGEEEDAPDGRGVGNGSTVWELESDELPPSSFMPEIPRVSVRRVKAKLDSGENILIIDSRAAKYYEKSHIAGAMLLPLEDMAALYDDLSAFDEIVTYCT